MAKNRNTMGQILLLELLPVRHTTFQDSHIPLLTLSPPSPSRVCHPLLDIFNGYGPARNDNRENDTQTHIALGSPLNFPPSPLKASSPSSSPLGASWARTCVGCKQCWQLLTTDTKGIED